MSKIVLLQAIWRETERRAQEWAKAHKSARINSTAWNNIWEQVKNEMCGNALNFKSYEEK